MSSDSKFFVIVAAVAVIVIGAIVFFTASNKSTTAGGNVPNINVTDGHKQGAGASAAVKIVEFGDFQCPFCGQAEPQLRQALSNNSSTVELIFRNFPLPQHPNALPAAQAAEAADLQGKYWEMHDWLYDNQSQWENSTNPKALFSTEAKQLGMNVGQFENDYATTGVAEKIKNDSSYGQSVKVDQTPTFFVNGKRVTGAQTLSQWQALIDQAKAAK